MRLTMHRVIQELNRTDRYADKQIPTSLRLKLRGNRRRMLDEYADYEPLHKEAVLENIHLDDAGQPKTTDEGRYDFKSEEHAEAFQTRMQELLSHVVTVDIRLASEDEFCGIDNASEEDVAAFEFMLEGHSVEESYIEDTAPAS